MPFKSEKQRKYLWANEPEIARDWTDTYGSRIHKLHGGITHADGRRGFFKGAEADARAGRASMSPGTHHGGGGRGYQNVHQTGAVTQTPGRRTWSPGVGGTQHIPRRKKWTGNQTMLGGDMWYKGGGIAKRGTGAAYKSGGRVKSMGIAKRGGGVAKR